MRAAVLNARLTGNKADETSCRRKQGLNMDMIFGIYDGWEKARQTERNPRNNVTLQPKIHFWKNTTLKFRWINPDIKLLMRELRAGNATALAANLLFQVPPYIDGMANEN